ncbi:MAG: serine hydrolase domain-containing protein, partial [Candidatus Limnocylindrales bacterium]
MTIPPALDGVDAIFERFHGSGAAPGLAYGVVVDGALVHTGGRGTVRVGQDAPPDADSVFRIASMTKSFTAATVLGLRDEGVLRLDDDVATWVPELAGLAPWSSDSPPITIRALLTMSGGLPTDDPWGDRQQDLDADAFLGLLSGGLELAWPTGTRFEYANLGYAILGLVIARATGSEYRAVVEERILGPLGLAGTGYDAAHVEPERVAHGYVKHGDDWIEQAMAAHGAFAPMGGLFSSVRDLAIWAGWLAAGFPPRDDPDDARPLSRASRREMQQVQRMRDPELRWQSAAVPPVPDVAGYGYGLFVGHDLVRGRVVGHGGGYPGFGSHMR